MVEIQQGGGTGGGGNSLTVTDGITTVTHVSTVDFTGAVVTDGGGGIADVTISGSGTPAPPDTSVQFNSAGSFAGTSGFTTNGFDILNLDGDINFGKELNHTIRVVTSTTPDTPGGNLSSHAGNGIGNAGGGSYELVAGDAELIGDGGFFANNAGAGGSVSGNGGDAQTAAGGAQAGDSNGGNNIQIAGRATGTGIPGKFQFFPKSAGTVAGVLDFDGLTTTDKTFTFPNYTGQLGLFSGLVRLSVSTTAPTSPNVGDLWFNISGL